MFNLSCRFKLSQVRYLLQRTRNQFKEMLCMISTKTRIQCKLITTWVSLELIKNIHIGGVKNVEIRESTRALVVDQAVEFLAWLEEAAEAEEQWMLLEDTMLERILHMLEARKIVWIQILHNNKWKSIISKASKLKVLIKEKCSRCLRKWIVAF